MKPQFTRQQIGALLGYAVYTKGKHVGYVAKNGNHWVAFDLNHKLIAKGNGLQSRELAAIFLQP